MLANPLYETSPVVTVPFAAFSIAPLRHTDAPLPTNTSMEGAVGISPDSLVSLLSCSDRSTLVLDCRPFMCYNTGHVVAAANVHCPPILKRRSGGFVALENIVPEVSQRDRLRQGGYSDVVVYDQNTHHMAQADTDSNLYSVVKSLMQQLDMDRVYYLVGGYDAFSEECPLLCASQQFSLLSAGRPETQQTVDQPVAEILPHLFLGDVVHSGSRGLLQRLGVTALLNVSTACPNHFPHDLTYLRVPVNDSLSDDLSSWFDTTCNFIDEVQSEGGRVLVHCHAGRSRSATVCLAYLMKTLNFSLDTAFEHVRSRREVIDPNLNFLRQLQDYRLRLDSEGIPSSSSSSTSSSSPCLSMSLSSSSSSLSGGGLGPQLMPARLLPPTLSPRTPRLAPSPLTLPSLSGSEPPSQAYSAADLPPPSPVTASGIQCFFAVSSPDLTFTESQLSRKADLGLPRTPQIPLPS